MPRSVNQKLKVLYLLRYLNENTDEEHPAGMQDILAYLERCGISAERKSIYADIEALGDFGIDIQRSANGYFIGSRDFDLPELKLLVDAVQSSKFITYRKSSGLIKKLEKLASRYQAVELQRQVFVANRIKSMNETIYYTVDSVNNAINGDRQICFRYYDRGADKSRIYRDGTVEVSPWAFVLDGENYYMVAYDAASEKIKHYRIDKMESASVSEKKREGEELFSRFDAALYAKKMFNMYSGREELVTLRCIKRLAGVMLDRFGVGITFIGTADGELEFTARVSVSPNFFGWLTCFGGSCRVVSPASVVDEYTAYISGILGKYSI